MLPSIPFTVALPAALDMPLEIRENFEMVRQIKFISHTHNDARYFIYSQDACRLVMQPHTARQSFDGLYLLFHRQPPPSDNNISKDTTAFFVELPSRPDHYFACGFARKLYVPASRTVSNAPSAW